MLKYTGKPGKNLASGTVFRRNCMRHASKKIRGSAILESLLAMFVIFLVLGILLQFFYFAVAQMLTDYAALRGVRSHAVGFKEYLVRRAIQVSAIGASGNIVTPVIEKGNPNRVYKERSYINSYLVGWRFMEYENWFGVTGNSFDEFKNAGFSTTFNHTVSSTGTMAKVRTKFHNYALLLLKGDNNGGKTVIQSRYIPGNESSTAQTNMFFGNLDLTGEASMRDHAATFLDLGGGK